MNAAFGWCSNGSVDKRVINTSIKPGMFHLHKNRLGQIMYLNCVYNTGLSDLSCKVALLQDVVIVPLYSIIED